MLLNRFETLMMNNPVRALVQRRIELPVLARMGGRTEGQTVLEVGCGRGAGVELLLDAFGAAKVHAFDLDPQMVALARRRLADRMGQVSLARGDVTAIEAPDESYDAVVDFGIIHHVPDWRRALSEIFRVLRPGGRFFAEEVLRRFILHPVWRRLLDHPLDDRFDHGAFCRGLEQQGFELLAERQIVGCFGWYVADKPAASRGPNGAAG